MGNIYLELTVILCIASFLAILFRFLKQPSILAYLLTGILIGPLALINLNNLEVIRSMAEIGITLLLFSLGLELKIADLRSVGKISIVSGLLQIGITGILGFLLGKVIGFSDIASLYLAAALTFSSTIIIVKFLSDKKDLRSLYGKITLGILLVQDMVAIGALILLTGLGNSKIDVYSLVILILKGIALFGWTYVLSKYLIPKVVSKIARSPEQLFLFSLAFVFGLSALVSSPFFHNYIFCILRNSDDFIKRCIDNSSTGSNSFVCCIFKTTCSSLGSWIFGS
ncbi:MAG: cation:proton antiporter [Candidatus Levybacteria bacterium]|nr:cation:proton antiporter [Candidatus Levybacteria bacterium]